MFLYPVHKIKDKIFLSGAGEVVFLGKPEGRELAAFNTLAAETAGGKIQDIFGHHLALYPFPLLASPRKEDFIFDLIKKLKEES